MEEVTVTWTVDEWVSDDGGSQWNEWVYVAMLPGALG